MKKKELIAAIAETADAPKATAEAFLNAFQDVVAKTLANGEEIQLVGFGTFSVKTRSERTGRNPSTGESIVIPESKVPSFKFGKPVKDAVAGK